MVNEKDKKLANSRWNLYMGVNERYDEDDLMIMARVDEEDNELANSG